jgi:hypothetical protein
MAMDVSNQDEQSNWMAETMKQLTDNPADEEIKTKLFYFIDKFRSLIKCYYRCYERCEMAGGKNPEDMALLRALFG